MTSITSIAQTTNIDELPSEHYPVVITGGGPAGLTAAYELIKRDIKPIVLEKSSQVGGIARTEIYKDYRFDIGGHRFFTKIDPVQKLWYEVLAKDFIKVPRLSRIYYNGKFFDYPLSLFNALSNLGIVESILILISYLKAKIRKAIGLTPEPETLEEWVTDSFGERLYLTFFKTYTEKVWGIPCNKIQAEWAAQRIQGLSLKRAVLNALFNSYKPKSLIKEFDYPRFGPGMMWERFQELIDENGGKVQLNSKVIQVERDGYHVKGILVERAGKMTRISGDHFISSMPITALVCSMNPLPPDEVITAAKSLSYRDFLIVALIVDAADLFPDNWIYIHAPEVKVGRIQNFKNWSPEMVPEKGNTCLGMEYFTTEGDKIWSLSDEQLIDLATEELATLKLAQGEKVLDGTVIRQRKAYPVYDGSYRQHLEVIQEYLSHFDNLQTVGRNGMHRYNNQDHSMLTAMLAVKNIMGENYDLWTVNTERSYYEEFTKEEWKQKQKEAKVLNP